MGDDVCFSGNFLCLTLVSNSFPQYARLVEEAMAAVEAGTDTGAKA